MICSVSFLVKKIVKEAFVKFLLINYSFEFR